MCISLLPTVVTAEKLPDTIEAPSAIHIRNDADFHEGDLSSYGTSLTISFNKGADLGNILTTMYETDFGEYYGIDDRFLQIMAQIDWSLDSQTDWQYRPHWDRGENANGDDVNNLPGEYTSICLNPDTTQEEWFFLLGHKNWG